MNIHIIGWILGAITAYRLWGDVTWLSIAVILLVLTYEVWPEEQREYETKGSYDNVTGTRLMLTFVLILIIFIYSLFR